MPISIRPATPQDAQAIAQLIKLAFEDEANISQIGTLISEGEHLTFVAEDKEVIGFVDGFYTVGAWGLRRLELDLIAVHPEHAGKGIGKQLIQTFTEGNDGAAFIRALVAVDNTPMQNAISKMGYQLQKPELGLYIADSGFAQKTSYQAQLIPVKTFTYTGIWLEGKIDVDALQSAHALRTSLDLEVVGLVLPNEEKKLIEILQANNFQFIKTFQWWHKA